AWFCGFNPEQVAVAWIGFDQPRNLGKGETGGAAALPIWINYMRVALSGKPEIHREMPEGLLGITPEGGGRQEFIYQENLPAAPPPGTSPGPSPEEILNGAPPTEAPAEATPNVNPAPVQAKAPVVEHSVATPPKPALGHP